MIASQRNLYILERLAECGIVDYKSISRELGVSEATVRRDFEKLERSGKLRRVQGGAMRRDGDGLGELSVLAKHNVSSDSKAAVAAQAALEVQQDECVFLDIGTSIAPLGRLLLRKRIRIITNNNLILQAVTPASLAEVHILGGQFVPEDQMFIGPRAEEMLSGCAVHRAFIGCMGLDAARDAVYVTDTSTLRIKQLAMGIASRRVLLLDHTKLKRVGLFRLCGVNDFDRVYIDGDIPDGGGERFTAVPSPESGKRE